MGGPSRKRVRQVFERDNWRCVGCETPDDLSVHHRVPRSAGGTNTLANLELLCWSCHRKEHGNEKRVTDMLGDYLLADRELAKHKQWFEPYPMNTTAERIAGLGAACSYWHSVWETAIDERDEAWTERDRYRDALREAIENHGPTDDPYWDKFKALVA